MPWCDVPAQSSLCGDARRRSGCIGILLTDLGYVCGDVERSLVEELDITITRTDKIGRASLGISVRGGSDTPMAFHTAASDVQNKLRRVMNQWGYSVSRLHPHVTLPDSAAADVIAEWLMLFPDLLSGHPDAARMAGEIRTTVSECFRVIDRPVDRVYIGPCGADGCEEPLYGVVGRPDIRCGPCGAVWNLSERRMDLAARAKDRLAVASDLVGFTTVLGRDVTTSMIRNFKSRGLLRPHGQDHRGRDLFRVGDLLEVLEKARKRRFL